MRPMLAGKFDEKLCVWPKLASAKLDGIRCLAIDGEAISRSLKPIPNLSVQKWFYENRQTLRGMDGELIVGLPNAHDVYRTTNSGVMSRDGEPDFTFHVFDKFSSPMQPYKLRLLIVQTFRMDRLKAHPYTLCQSVDELTVLERLYLEQGYEGVILRDPRAPYKQGRSSTREGGMLKVKQFEDAEAVIIGFKEEMANGNEGVRNALGNLERSSHQANKVGKGTLGALTCRLSSGIEFDIGTGFDAAERAVMWDTREDLLGQTVKFKHFPIGVKDAPRHPVFIGVRHVADQS